MFTKKTVALVGSARSTRDQAPFDDETVEIWGMNEALKYPWMRRADAMFQMHQRWSFTRENNRNDPDHWAWLRAQHPFPIYMQEAYEDVPSAHAYPLAWVIDVLNLQRAYFTGTAAYMVALALAQGYERIELYGVELSTGTEWDYQRDCLTYWLGIAEGRGVEVYLPPACGLLKGKLYGYEGGKMIERLFFEERFKILAEKFAHVDSAWKTKAAEVKYLAELPDEAPEKYQRLNDAVRAEREALVERTGYFGAYQECKAYLEEYDQIARAAGNPHGERLGDYQDTEQEAVNGT